MRILEVSERSIIWIDPPLRICSFVVLVLLVLLILKPLDDFVDFSSAEISAEGDAKLHASKRLDDFKGNATLERFMMHRWRGRVMHCPFLHFSREKSGWVNLTLVCSGT